MEFPSRLVEDAVTELSRLPGIGRKTALRLALHILRKPEGEADSLGKAIIDLRKNIKYCTECGNIADEELCGICASHKRDTSMICVVEDCKDVIALENTNEYRGLYHVLGGLINPLGGISPSQLNIDSLVDRLKKGECTELIFAFSTTMEGDTTAFYISKKIRDLKIRSSSIARGIPVGSDLEYADEITLARSLMHRTHFNTQDTNGL